MNLNSKKIELKSRIRLMWIVVLSILLLSIVVSCIDYSSYRKGQDFGISAQAFVIEDIIESNDTHQIKCKKLYNYFTRVYTDVTLDGIKYDYSQSRKTQDKVKEIFTEYMSVGGYHRYSKYSIENWFKYKNVFEYYFLHSSCQPFSVISYILVLIALILTFDVIRKQKRKLTITEEILICEYNKKKIKEIMIKDVISVECSKKGLHLSGNGIKFKIHLISNADELKKLIIEKKTELSKNNSEKPSFTTNADEIKKFKDLLDNGIITQEEFDEKKKQLLGI